MTRHLASIFSRMTIFLVLVVTLVFFTIAAFSVNLVYGGLLEAQGAVLDRTAHEVELSLDLPLRLLGFQARALGRARDFATGKELDLQSLCRDIQQADERFGAVLITDGQGVVVGQGEQVTSMLGFDLSRDAGIVRVLEAGQAIFTRPSWSMNTNALIISLLVPVETSGTVKGVIVAEIKLDSLRHQLDLQSVESASTLVILDDSGNLISHPDPAITREQRNYGDNPLFRAIRTGDHGPIIHYDAVSRDFLLGSASKIARDWYILGTRSLSLAFRPLFLLLGLILVALAVAALAFRTFQRRMMGVIVEPLRALMEAVDAVAMGTYQGVLQVPGVVPAEFSTLLERFALMATALKERDELLESRVKERTKQLEEALASLDRSFTELSLAKDQLVATERMAALGNLVAGVAHEINTPVGNALTAISLTNDRIREIRELHEGKALSQNEFELFLRGGEESTGIAMRNIRRAVELIQAFKQVAVDQSSEAERDFDLAELIADTLASLRHGLRQAGIGVVVDCPAQLWIRGQAGYYIQILSNLIMNAQTHAFKGVAQPSLLIRAARDATSRLLLEVADNGVGIPQELHHKVFEPFFTTRRNEGGSGLGLSIVFNLVNSKLHGDIRLDSAPGHGSRFCMHLIVEWIETGRT